VREFAAQAGRPFEAAVGVVALSIVIESLVPGITGTPGTIFDFCENRADIVKVIRVPRIDQQNRERIPAELLEPTDKILTVLTEYAGSTTPEQIRRQRKVLARTAKKRARSTRSGTLAPQVSFETLLKALNASLPKPAVKKPAIAKRHGRKTAMRGK